METVTDFIFWGSKITAGSDDQPRQPVKKQRHQFADKDLYIQSYGFSSSHVQMWQLGHKDGCDGGLVAKLCLTLVIPRTVAYQAPLSMVFSRQDYWSGLPFPSLGDLPDPGIESGSSALQADDLLTEKRWMSTEELMVLNCGAGEDSWESLGQQGDQISQS